MSSTGERGESYSEPKLCERGCGFFASPTTANLCSKCYRDFQAEQERANKSSELLAGAAAAEDLAANPAVAELEAAPRAAQNPSPCAEATALAEPAGLGGATAATSSAAAGGACDGEPPVQQKPNRCFECNKRVGLTGFKCRCGYVYCATHRYAEKHACPFDYKAAGRQTLAKNNPLVAASKVDKL